jgi:hypothetical protein
MTSIWHYLKRNCPICNGVRSDCRENTQRHLIHCRHDAVSAPGYQCVGEDKWGFFMWSVNDGREYNPADWEQQRRERTKERLRRLQAEDKRCAALLSVEERAHYIRKLSQQVGLSHKHRQHLRQERGLSDEAIDRACYFTIEPYQEVRGISPTLAGIDLWGRKLTIGQHGLGCPIFDVFGQIIGFQVRFDNATENKYKWPTSRSKFRPNGPSAHLPNGELPIAVWHPLGEVKCRSIGMSEGINPKPYIVAQRLGQPCLGAAGGNFAASPQQLQESLNILSTQLNTKTIDFYPDAGAVTNSHVLRQYQATFKLLQEWGYKIRVAWWGQTTKGEHSDIDDLLVAERGDEIQFITIAQFELLCHNSTIPLHGFKDLFGWFPKLKNRLTQLALKRSRWGFAPPATLEIEPTPLKAQPIEYPTGQRFPVWTEAIQQGGMFIFDSSTTGTGKSFDSGLTHHQLFDCRQVIFLASEHRNPTVSTLLNWTDLEARHAGLINDSFGRKRRAKPGESYIIPPNCGRNQTINALRKLHINGADTASVICATCPHLEACRGGHIFGFLHQRQTALKSSRLRAHPESLPDPFEYDYSDVVLLWDEWSALLRTTRTLEVNVSDLDQLIVQLVTKNPKLYSSLADIFEALRDLLTGFKKQPNRYGWNHTAIVDLLPQLPQDLDYCAIEQALAPDLRKLDPTAEYGISMVDLPKAARLKFTEKDTTLAETIKQKFLLQWLLPFLSVLGSAAGYLRIANGVLSIILPDDRLVRIARSAKANIFLDATGDSSELALMLGVSPSEIIHVRQIIPEPNNLEVIQVTNLGRLGNSDRSSLLHQRLNAVVNKLLEKDSLAKVIDFKKFALPGSLRWWIESRGVNDLESTNTLILVGTPCRNLSDLEADFALMHRRVPQPGIVKVKYPVLFQGQLPTNVQPYFEMKVSADPEFRAFVRRRILADIHQAIGRLRAHRRPGEKLCVYFLGDYPLDLPVTLVPASDISPEAADKTERVELAIKAAVAQLQAMGQKVTQKAIASLTGYSQQHISRFRNLLIKLIESPNSQKSKIPDQEAQWLSQEYLPLVADLPPQEMLQEVATLWSVYGSSDLRRLWEMTPAGTQIAILTQLMLTLRTDELSQLAMPTGVG